MLLINYLGVKRKVLLAPVAGCSGGTLPTKTRPLICDLCRFGVSAESLNHPRGFHIHILRAQRPQFPHSARGKGAVRLSGNTPSHRDKKRRKKKKREETGETPILLCELTTNCRGAVVTMTTPIIPFFTPCHLNISIYVSAIPEALIRNLKKENINMFV